MSINKFVAFIKGKQTWECVYVHNSNKFNITIEDTNNVSIDKIDGADWSTLSYKYELSNSVYCIHSHNYFVNDKAKIDIYSPLYERNFLYAGDVYKKDEKIDTFIVTKVTDSNNKVIYDSKFVEDIHFKISYPNNKRNEKYNNVKKIIIKLLTGIKPSNKHVENKIVLELVDFDMIIKVLSKYYFESGNEDNSCPELPEETSWNVLYYLNSLSDRTENHIEQYDAICISSILSDYITALDKDRYVDSVL